MSKMYQNQVGESSKLLQLSVDEFGAAPFRIWGTQVNRTDGMKAGRARAAKLTPEQRKEIAQRAAKARWGKG